MVLEKQSFPGLSITLTSWHLVDNLIFSNAKLNEPNSCHVNCRIESAKIGNPPLEFERRSLCAMILEIG